MFTHEFMRNALWALLMITPLLGLLGTVVVESKLAFFSDALGHSALTGIALGTLLGITDTTLSMVLFALGFAYLLNRIRRSGVASNDTVISVFSSTAIALGLAILSRSGSFNKFSGYLIGDILTISSKDLLPLALLSVCVLIYWLLFYNDLLLISVSPLMAAAKGTRVKSMQTAFMLILAVVVMVAIRWVGILVINSLLILPAAAARNVSRNSKSLILLSLIFALCSGVGGLMFSYWLNTATGPTVTLCGAVLFFATFLIRGRVKG
ncbi:MAG: metal ABC transporter permease [Oscillospiraceae bacterium]|nr:metal ABC transporter permease [Oscillospiraceae bacterium]